MWLLLGLVPFFGIAIFGHWSERELGIATVILIFSGYALVSALMRMLPRPLLKTRELLHYAAAASVVALATALSVALRDYLAAPDLVMVYLVGIGVVAVRWGRGPAVASSALSVLAYNFFFVPPYYAVWVHDHRHWLTFVMMFGVGLLISGMMLRLRQQALQAREATLKARTEEMRSSLLSAVSHDLRTPLAVITGAATTLRDEAATQSASTRELIDTVCEEADRLERLVRNLLDMTQLEAGMLQPKREWVPLEEIVGAALTRLEPQLATRPIRTIIPSDLPLIHVDPVLIEQVLINLLENCCKYSPANSAIEIQVVTQPEATLLELSDNGPGIAPGMEEHIFERFFRAPSTGSSRGAGLGLAICRGIVEAHGGTIRAENKPSGGALFRVTLPRIGAAPAVPSDMIETASTVS
jgi:K+-sensing histidine kinase KdpD